MRPITKFSLFLMLAFLVGACQKPAEQHASANPGSGLQLNPANFRKVIDGKKTDLFILKNDNGMQVAITNYGGRIVGISAPDENGNVTDVVLGHDSLGGYLHGSNSYFGAIVGRFANRIRHGKFTLEGKQYSLPINDGVNTLHGGVKGFDSHVWDAQKLDDQNLLLSYKSKDNEEGFPGNLTVQVLYTLTANNGLQIEYTAVTDKPTVLNLTNHAYFNLNGAGNGKITDEVLMINADSFTPIDSTMIPTGEITPVEGTPFDFTKPHKIGDHINDDTQQIKYAHGYDDNWVLNKKKPYLLSLAASVYEPSNGRELDVYTTEPGIQFYTSNFLNGSTIGKGGKPYNYRTAFTVETQHYPDSPNHPNFPSTELKPGQIFHSITIYQFSIHKDSQSE